nr:MAG TPA: hypothetical protein [Caudoviricetes sp.]
MNLCKLTVDKNVNQSYYIDSEGDDPYQRRKKEND